MKYVLSALLLLGIFAGVNIAHAADTDPLVKKLQDISVTIRAGRSQGSGVMFTRAVGDETRTYIWTAAHVIDGLRSTREVVVNGNKKTVVEFKDAAIVQEFKQNGRRIGEVKMDARVIRYSNADDGEDLALLEVRKRDFAPVTSTAVFYLDDDIPTIGTELYHVGSLLGQVGANSLTTGVISQIGRVVELKPEGTVFDQTTVTAFPGSSGGGVFLKSDGRYIGMLVRGSGEQFNLIVPARRILQWATDAKIAWALDPAVVMPLDDELAKIPVEDAGVVFDNANYRDAPKPNQAQIDAINTQFPHLLEFGDCPTTPWRAPRPEFPSAY